VSASNATASGKSSATASGPRTVRQSRMPAIFQKYGERVLFLDDKVFLFDDEDDGQGREADPTVIDASALEEVGIEYGWRHASDCRCRFCAATGK
jgi:hypothetical protein